jgi:hypothetical protein
MTASGQICKLPAHQPALLLLLLLSLLDLGCDGGGPVVTAAPT